MEPDISILRKTGHFYFALTQDTRHLSLQSENVLFVQSRNVRFSHAEMPAPVVSSKGVLQARGSHGSLF
jgi:hypothetical protein